MLCTLDVRRFTRRVAPVCASITTVFVVLAADGIGPGASASVVAALGALHPSAKPAPARAAVTSSSSPPAEARQTLVSASGAGVVVYPPIATPELRGAGAPLVVMLHGMCSDPEPTCDFWSRAGREGSFLVCPAGNSTCSGAPDWAGTGEVKAAAIDEGLAAVALAYKPYISHERGDILMGFSRGAFVARDVAYARPGRFQAIVLLGASMRPDAARLKASGIHRVVMAAGEYDGARSAMQRAVVNLNARGLQARYISLGRIGHALPHNLEEIMRDALRWVREGIPAR